jgi:hypothetical protein
MQIFRILTQLGVINLLPFVLNETSQFIIFRPEILQYELEIKV